MNQDVNQQSTHEIQVFLNDKQGAWGHEWAKAGSLVYSYYRPSDEETDVAVFQNGGVHIQQGGSLPAFLSALEMLHPHGHLQITVRDVGWDKESDQQLLAWQSSTLCKTSIMKSA